MPASRLLITPRCPVRTALELLSGKWRLLLLQQVATGAARYGELRQSLPDISEKVLAHELKFLVDAGLLTRQDAPEGLVRSLYALTALGEQTQPVTQALARFGLAYNAEVALEPSRERAADANARP
ncbi:transcriptional regulator [Hymenobacter gummosus]|uniref:Transcriptional regulator n=1 Tax=Hymenobacter gummosus TaxID=1776032 RepID=A0A431TVZ9_9BACT|nr:helix-turn-helix domain-containing protein [Hymenobacter gummosus]RTQ45678.1 transcriptional regulator [Hymenobacter gummosus]